MTARTARTGQQRGCHQGRVVDSTNIPVISLLPGNYVISTKFIKLHVPILNFATKYNA